MNNKDIFLNFIWRFAERIGAQMVAFVVSIVLARLLEPSAYGTVALLTIFTIILQVFVDSGLGNALIQKKDADNIDFSTVFFTNIAFCTALYILLFLASPIIASFYKDDAMTAYLRVLGITVFVSGIKNVQQAYVSRNMLFKRFFYSTLGGTIAAGVVGVMLAYSGFGVWALVAQQVVNLVIDTTILWVTVKWRPEFTFSFTRLKGLFSYGWKLLASRLIDTVYVNVTQLLVGKIYSSADLAHYNRGNHFPNLIITNVNTSIDSVLLPAMSKDQESRERVKNMTRRSIKVSTYIIAPLMMGLAFCGESIVGLILTNKWLPSVFYMRIFCITYMFYPIHTANLNAIKAVGRSDLFLKLEIEKKVIGIIALICTVFIGVKAMTYSLLFTSIASQIINSFPNKKLLGYGYKEQLKDILPSIALAVCMGIAISPVDYIVRSYFVRLLIQIPIGAIIYIVGSNILRIDSFEYLWTIVKTYLKRKW